MGKRIFDIVFSVVVLVVLSWLLAIGYVVASIDTGSSGLFLQKRIGQFGKPFTIFKFKTIHPHTAKVSAIGFFLRKYKIDELPQLLNVLIGNMSFVGPRPDVAGYYDLLKGENRKILQLKPGITSESAIKYYNEEMLLAHHENPIDYNDKIIFPDKIRMNLDYYYHRSFWKDIKILWATVFR